MRPVYFKRFNFDVGTALSTVTKDFEIDKGVYVVTGLLLTADQEDQLFFRGSQSITINGVEIFPDGYGSKLLMSGLGVPPDKRYYSLGRVETINGKIRVVFTDTDNPMLGFNPYKVSLYVRGLQKPLT